MASSFPLALDSFTTKIDGVTDVMAEHVNSLQDSVVAAQTALRNLLLVKNTSGATAAANDLGYINEAGEYKTTTSAALVANWCVVIAGAANNADIIVVQTGRVTVKYTGSAPTAGQFLTTSTVAGSALASTPQTTAVFGVAIAAGAGGTVSARMHSLNTRLTAAEDDITAIEADITSLETLRIGENLLADTLTHEASWLAGTSFGALTDDQYGPTLWNTLTNSASSLTFAGIAGGSTDPFTRHLRATFNNSGQAGIVQFLTAEKTRPLRGQVVSLSADFWGTAVANLRMNVIVWTSTADAVTSDVISTFSANPTLATNWAYIGTPTDIAITGSQVRYTPANAANLLIPTNANNIAVFIWTPTSEANTDLFNVARVKLEIGPTATAFVGRDPGQELNLISHFYTKSYATGIAPGTNTLVNMAMAEGYSTANAATNNAEFPVAMRTTPTVTIYSTAGTAAKISTVVPADIGTTVTAIQPGDRRIPALTDSGAGLTAGTKYFFHYVADCRL